MSVKLGKKNTLHLGFIQALSGVFLRLSVSDSFYFFCAGTYSFLMYRLTPIWVNLLLSLRSVLFLHSVSCISPLRYLCDVPVFPSLDSLMQLGLFRQWISFHGQSHLFDLFFFSPYPFLDMIASQEESNLSLRYEWRHGLRFSSLG